MNFGTCLKCKLVLPRNYLSSVQMRTRQGVRKGLICENCKKILDEQFKEGGK